MFDPQLLSNNPLAKEGIKFLYQSQILHQQQQALLERLATGDSAAPEEEVVRQIREFRVKNALIEDLIQTAERLIEEHKGEEQ